MKKPVKRKVFKRRPRRPARPVKKATIALMLSLSFLLGCKAKPVIKPFKPSKPVPVKRVELPKLKDFDQFLKAFREKLKKESPEQIALEYPIEDQKRVREALTFLARAKEPANSEARLRELNDVLKGVERYINEQTRLDRATMGLLAEQWVRERVSRPTEELLKEKLELEAMARVPDEFAYDARAVTLEIIYRILRHRLQQAK